MSNQAVHRKTDTAMAKLPRTELFKLLFKRMLQDVASLIHLDKQPSNANLQTPRPCAFERSLNVCSGCKHNFLWLKRIRFSLEKRPNSPWAQANSLQPGEETLLYSRGRASFLPTGSSRFRPS